MDFFILDIKGNVRMVEPGRFDPERVARRLADMSVHVFAAKLVAVEV